MSLLSRLFVVLALGTQIMGLATHETPLLDPSLSAREVALSRASFSDHHFNNMLRNPASIASTRGVAMQATEYLGISYSAVAFVHNHFNTSFGVHYVGSSVDTMMRSVVDTNDNGLPLVKETDNIIPYEYHAISFSTAKMLGNFSFGGGFRHKTLILDNQTNTNIEGMAGIIYTIVDEFSVAVSITNYIFDQEASNDLQGTEPILSTGLKFTPTKKVKFFIGVIKNNNEISTHPTFHTSLEYYMNDYLPIRMGLDHNRYTLGTGLYLDPFEIDIALAQSRDPIIDHQLTIGFSYGLEEKNNLY